jgi:hypothetical protein
MPRGEISAHQHSSLDQIGIIEERQEALIGHCDIFGEGPITVLAGDTDRFAKRLIAS